MSRRGFFLDIQALPPPLSAATHTQGVALYRQQRVLECVLNRVSQQEWGAAGSVKGHSAAAHSVSAVVETDSDGRVTFFSSQCDCRVGRHCLHGVALVVKGHFQSEYLPASPDPVNPQTDAPRAVFQPYQSHGLFDDAPLLPPALPMRPGAAAAAPLLVPTAWLHISRIADHELARLGLLRATLRFDYAGTVYYALDDTNPVRLEAVQGSTATTLLHRNLMVERAIHHALHALGLTGDSQGRFGLTLGDLEQQQRWLQWADDGFAAFRAAGLNVTQDSALTGWIQVADDLQARLIPSAESSGAQQHRVSVERSGRVSGHTAWFTLSLGMRISGVGGIHEERRSVLPALPQLLASLTAVFQSAHASPGFSLPLTASPLTTTVTAQLPPHVFWPQGDGTFVRLPTAPLLPWLQALLELLAERTPSGGFSGNALRLSRIEAVRLGVVLAGGAAGADRLWQGADDLQALAQQLAGQQNVSAMAAPTGLRAVLRPYQLQGLAWLQLLRRQGLGGLLADDMGLGKTLQTLAHVLLEKQAGRLDRPVLIVTPVSLLGTWRREAERFTPTLRTLVLHGSNRAGEATKIPFQDIVIAPYSLLQRDGEHWHRRAWHLVVLDEAQNIKNSSSQAARVVTQLDTRHRLCLSGTPIENHLGELWSLFHFLMPGLLGSITRFHQTFRTPIEKHGDALALAQLRRRVMPFMLRRHKKDVAADLPDKQAVITPVVLGDAQASLYETIRLTTEKSVRQALAGKGLARSKLSILEALLKLRQVCCHPRLVAVPAAQHVRQSAKLDWLMATLPRLLAEGRTVLVFSQFTSMLALIEVELATCGLRWATLTGQTQKRDTVIERFTSGAVPLFLISLKAGGVGLNLPQADTVIHFDPWWNPAVETQATDRAHRIGQTRTVTVYKLVARGTIEERIVALQARKAALAASLHDAPHGGPAAMDSAAPNTGLFSAEDLDSLLQPIDS